MSRPLAELEAEKNFFLMAFARPSHLRTKNSKEFLCAGSDGPNDIEVQIKHCSKSESSRLLPIYDPSTNKVDFKGWNGKVFSFLETKTFHATQFLQITEYGVLDCGKSRPSIDDAFVPILYDSVTRTVAFLSSRGMMIFCVCFETVLLKDFFCLLLEILLLLLLSTTSHLLKNLKFLRMKTFESCK